MTGSTNQKLGFTQYTLAILLAFYSATAAAGQGVSSTTTDNISQQIKMLGSADYSVRLQARSQLLKIGVPAIAQLQAAVKLKHRLDHETQLQAASILAELRKVEIAVGTKQFLAGVGDLTCWDQFKQHFGDQLEQRTLYAELFSEFHQLIETEAKTSFESQGHSEIRKLLTAKQALQTAMAIFILVEKLSTSQPDDRPLLTTSQIELNLSSLQNAKKTISNSKHETAIHQQIQILLNLLPADKHLVGRKLSTLKLFQSPIFNPQLLDLVDSDQPPVIRAIAVSSLSTTGDESTIQALAKWLNDTTEVGNFLQPVAKNDPPSDEKLDAPAKATSKTKQIFTTVQIRDLCLLASVSIAKMKPTDFGFHKNAISGNEIDVKSAGFATQPQREAAFQKWQQTGN